jgi:hypothetical protein
VTRLALLWSVPALFAVYMPSCHTPSVRPTMPPWEARMAEFWEAPADLETRDLFFITAQAINRSTASPGKWISGTADSRSTW